MVTEAEYESLKAWLGFILEHPVLGFGPISPAIHPVTLLSESEKSAPASARRGLKMAIGDTIEMCSDMPLPDVMLIDEGCRLNGLPTLSEVRSRFSRNLKSIVRRGAIRNETEYYLVRNAIELASDDDERAKLQTLLTQFET